MKRVMLKVNKYHKQLWLELNDTYSLNKKKTGQIYVKIVIDMNRVILKANKYHKQLLWLELNDTYTLNKQKTVDLHHNSNRDEESHIENKQIS